MLDLAAGRPDPAGVAPPSTLPPRPQFCFVCGSVARFACPGSGGGQCRVQASLCLACKQGKSCFVCRIAGSTASNKNRDTCFTNEVVSCAACGYSLDSSHRQCTVCGVKLCGLCNFRTNRDAKKSFTCIACLGEESFYDKIKKEARTITKEITHAFEGGHSLSQSEMQDLFFNFCETVDVLNRLVMYRDLKPMWPLLLRILEYQDSHKLECHLGALQAVRSHAEPRSLHSELVRTVARLKARCSQTDYPPE